jgi:hypothetical protein
VYLLEKYGLHISPKTLANYRWAGTGPACRYLGATPLYEEEVLDTWMRESLRDEPPKRAKQAA